MLFEAVFIFVKPVRSLIFHLDLEMMKRNEVASVCLGQDDGDDDNDDDKDGGGDDDRP